MYLWRAAYSPDRADISPEAPLGFWLNTLVMMFPSVDALWPSNFCTLFSDCKDVLLFISAPLHKHSNLSSSILNWWVHQIDCGMSGTKQHQSRLIRVTELLTTLERLIFYSHPHNLLHMEYITGAGQIRGKVLQLTQGWRNLNFSSDPQSQTSLHKSYS